MNKTQINKFFGSGGVSDNSCRVGHYSGVSNNQSAHARSARLAGHKWLGRRVDSAWRVHDARASTFSTKGQRNISTGMLLLGLSINNPRNKELK